MAGSHRLWGSGQLIFLESLALCVQSRSLDLPWCEETMLDSHRLCFDGRALGKECNVLMGLLITESLLHLVSHSEPIVPSPSQPLSLIRGPFKIDFIEYSCYKCVLLDITES